MSDRSWTMIRIGGLIQRDLFWSLIETEFDIAPDTLKAYLDETGVFEVTEDTQAYGTFDIEASLITAGIAFDRVCEPCIGAYPAERIQFRPGMIEPHRISLLDGDPVITLTVLEHLRLVHSDPAAYGQAVMAYLDQVAPPIKRLAPLQLYDTAHELAQRVQAAVQDTP